MNENILLRKTNSEEKEDFLKYNHFSDWQNYEVNHCFEFKIDEKFIKKVELDSGSEDLEEFVLIEALWHLIKMGESINICKTQPCEILRIDLISDEYIPDFADNFWLSPKPKYFEDVLSVIKKDDIKTINSVFLLLLESDKRNSDYRKYWWLIPVEYYNKHNESIFNADQIIDLNIALESLLSNENMEISYRLRLRSSFYLYHINHYHPKQVQQIVKEMYNLRSKIVHGTISLDKPDSIEITYVPGNKSHPPEKIFISVATRMLKEIIRIMILDAILNHSQKSREEFIDFIDNIWYFDDKTPFNLIDDYEIVYSVKDSSK